MMRTWLFGLGLGVLGATVGAAPSFIIEEDGRGKAERSRNELKEEIGQGLQDSVVSFAAIAETLARVQLYSAAFFKVAAQQAGALAQDDEPFYGASTEKLVQATEEMASHLEKLQKYRCKLEKLATAISKTISLE